MRSRDVDPYEILGLEHGATWKEVRTAYRRLAKKHHPDKNPGDKTSEWIFKQVGEAYERLELIEGTRSRRREDHKHRGPQGSRQQGREPQSRADRDRREREQRDKERARASHDQQNSHLPRFAVMWKRISRRMSGRMTPLHLAAKSCSDATAISALLDGGAELEAKDRRGRTALHYGAQNSRAAALSALVKAGANVNAEDRRGRTPLHWAAFSRSGTAKWDSPGFTLARRCFPDSKLRGIADVIETVQHQAELVRSDPEVVRVLLDAGAKLSARDKHGATPLHYAAAFSPNPATASALLEAGARVSTTDKTGSTPLHDAAGNGNAAVVMVLLAAGAELTAQDRKGDTPLHRAVAYGHSDVAAVLLDAGGQTAVRNRRGKTPLDIARRYRVSPEHFDPLRRSPAYAFMENQDEESKK